MVPAVLDEQKKASEKLPILGHLTWWTVGGVSITHDDLEDRFEKAGLPAEWLIDAPDKESAFLRACREAPGQHAANRNKNRLLVRQILKSVEKFVFGVVDENIDQMNQSLDYNYKCKITFDRKNGNIESTNEDHPAVQLIKSLTNQYFAYHDSSAFRGQILECLEKLQKLNLRDRGGVYFIPLVHEKILEKLEGLVNGVGSSQLFTMPQIDVIKSRQAMVDVFLSDFESEIQTYKEELSAFAEKGDALRESTLDKRVEVFKALHQKMELYAGLLQFEPKDVKAKITDLEQDLTKIKFGRKVKLDEDDKKTANG